MRLAAVLPALLLTACAQQAERTREGGHPTIVSLNPCSDAILAEVADPAQVLAISHYSHDPSATSMELAAAKRFAITGGTVEEVLALGPDVVVADIFLPPATAQAFARLGVRVETVGIASSIAESEQQVAQLAALAGHPERGAALNARIEAALDAARPASRGKPVSTLLWQQGGIVAGPGSLIAELMQRTGFASHSAARGLGQGAYLPLEQALADPPELVLAAGGERALAHPALKQLKGTAYRQFDPSLVFCGGPTIVRAAEDLRALRDAVRPSTSSVPTAPQGERIGKTPAHPEERLSKVEASSRRTRA